MSLEEDEVPAAKALAIFAGVIVIGVSLCLVAWFLLRAREHSLRPAGFPEQSLPAPGRDSEPFDAVDVEEHLGAQLPRLTFTDESGARFPLETHKPTLMVLAYLRCQMLCDLVLRGLVDSLAKSNLRAGRDFDAVTVSIDPKDTPGEARVRKIALLQTLGQPDAPWHFLVGDQGSIHSLAERLGFRYVYDPKSNQFAHPAAVFVLTGDGRISRYLYGVRFRPLDVKLAIAEASQGKIGSLTDRVLLTCFKWDPSSRRYGFVVNGVMKGGAALVALLLLAGILYLIRLEKRR